MESFFYFSYSVAILVFLILNRFTFFTLFFSSSTIYFFPMLVGFYIEKRFEGSSVLYVKNNINEDVYIFGCLYFLILSFFHFLSLRISKKRIKTVNAEVHHKIILTSVVLAAIFQSVILLKIIGQTDASKLHLMEVTAAFINVKVFFQLFAVVCIAILVNSKERVKNLKILFLILLFLHLIDIYIGYRYTSIYALCALSLIIFYNRKFSLKFALKGVFFGILFVLVFSAIGNLRNELRVFDFITISSKVSSVTWWLWGLMNMEPVFQFNILNKTIGTGLTCNAAEQLASQFTSVFVPFAKYIISYSTFHDCFVPIISPKFEQIASNPWAQFYSYSGFSGMLVFTVALNFLFLFLVLLAVGKSEFWKIFSVVLLSIMAIYLQRSEVFLIIVSTYRIIIGLAIVYIAAELISTKTIKKRNKV